MFKLKQNRISNECESVVYYVRVNVKDQQEDGQIMTAEEKVYITVVYSYTKFLYCSHFYFLLLLFSEQSL